MQLHADPYWDVSQNGVTANALKVAERPDGIIV
jgi:hypothetical protein